MRIFAGGGDKYYVDKSLLIKDILNDNDRGIYLFTRPHRFGKTTNLSMLDAFFNMKYDGNTWFDDLAISQYPEFDAYRNAFPVVNINLKKSKAQNYESFIKRMRSVVYDAFDEHRYLLETEDLASDQRARFEEVLNEKTDEALISERIPLLCKLLEKHHGKKTVVLIDEYDRAASDSFGSESFRPIMDFLGEFMNSLLKNNDSLQMAYVTGVMRITKESIFSGLNNLKVNNVFSSMSDERFGFTESEIKQALSDFRHPEKFEEAKQWYDGYRFGNAEVYNPFSIMNYISDGFAPMPYWANSGSDWIVRKLLENIDEDNYAEILSLVTGGSVAAELTPTLSFDDASSEDESLYSLMVVSDTSKPYRWTIGDIRYPCPTTRCMNRSAAS